jgi:hypothetical protein
MAEKPAMHPFGTYIISISFVFASCEKLTHVYSFRQSGMIAVTSMHIATITPLVAKAGDEITVTGSELGGQSTIMIGGNAVQVYGRGTAVTFTMPKMPYAGAFKVTIGRLHDQSGPVDLSAAFIISDSAGDNIPIYMAVAAEVCRPTQFRDADGVLTVGTKDCVPAPNCTAAGQKGCKTTTTMVGVEASFLIAANIKAGVTVGGVAGSYAGAYSTCAVSGGQSCVTSGLYYAGAACIADASNCFLSTYDVTTQPLKAVDYNSIDQSKMLDSLTIAGATGTVVSRGSWALTETFPGAGYYTGVTSQPVAASIVHGTTLIGVAGAAPLRPADVRPAWAVTIS